MTSAFCPGHVSCVFQPVYSYDVLATGSRGVGIRLSLGARAEVEPRGDGEVRIVLDGEPSEAPVTRRAVEDLAPGEGFDIRIDNDLPVSQGFGMSAAGSVAASLCVAHLTGEPRQRAFVAAHVAETECAGGLGDVSGIMAGRDVPVRTVGGLPPHGNVVNAGFSFPRLTLAVLGPKMSTATVLGAGRALEAIRAVGAGLVDEFLEDPTREKLFEVSNRFSCESGLESPAVRRAIDRLNGKGYGAGMCLLGSSVFTDAPPDVVRSALGRGRVKVFPCSSTSREAMVVRGSRSLVKGEQPVVPADVEEPDPRAAVQPRVRVVDGGERRHQVPLVPEVPSV